MQPVSLDKSDRAILEVLQSDATLSAADVGEQVGLSQSPCWRRIQRLREKGVIRDQVALIDRKKVGFDTMVFATVKLSAHGRSKLSDFAEAIQRFPEVLECYVLMGSMDFMLKIVTRDIEAYEHFFFEDLSQLPGVQEINSTIAMSEIKQTTALPVQAG